MRDERHRRRQRRDIPLRPLTRGGPGLLPGLPVRLPARPPRQAVPVLSRGRMHGNGHQGHVGKAVPLLSTGRALQEVPLHVTITTRTIA